MKKRIFSLLLALCLSFSLCACDNEKANYKKAITYLDSEQYSEAIPLLEELGDYEESAKYLQDAKWLLLRQYVIEEGEHSDDSFMLSTNYTAKYLASDWEYFIAFYVDEDEPDVISLYATRTSNFFTDDILVSLVKDTDTALFHHESKMEFQVLNVVSHSNATYEGTFTPSECTKNTKLLVSTYSYYMNDIYGNITTSNDPNDASTNDLNTYFHHLLDGTKYFLNEIGLGITMKDIGFVSLA